MSEERKDELHNGHIHDGVDRQEALKCMAWAGTGELCLMQSGVLKSYNLRRMLEWGPKGKSILIERKQ
jgi:hypothetical protein